MNKRELNVLLNFLKSGYSTRQLDKLLGFKGTRGWKSWEILKKYQLLNDDKGKLFLYSVAQAKNIISKIVKSKQKRLVDKLVKQYPPNNLEKYKNTFVIAESDNSFYQIFSGETRNIVQGFFAPKKKLINKCQFKDCKRKGPYDTVHLAKERPLIFKECASGNKRRFGFKLFKFDVYKTMKCFLLAHNKKDTVCFLCKKHHNELHRNEKLGKKQLSKFRNNIMT